MCVFFQEMHRISARGGVLAGQARAGSQRAASPTSGPSGLGGRLASQAGQQATACGSKPAPAAGQPRRGARGQAANPIPISDCNRHTVQLLQGLRPKAKLC